MMELCTEAPACWPLEIMLAYQRAGHALDIWKGEYMPPTVTLYSAPWCGYCRVAKRFLDEQRVPYTEVNIDEDEAAAQRVEQWNNGNRTIPTLDINGTILTNPTPAQLRHVLGL